MDLKTFLTNYRNGVRAATGKLLSRREVVVNIFGKEGVSDEEIGKIEKKYEKWEVGKAKPKDDSDRNAIKSFFGIVDLENISEDVLNSALTRSGNPNKKRIPMIGEAVAGTEMQLNVGDQSHNLDEYIDVGDMLRDSEAAFTVYGNSMTPAYPSGCLLGIRRNLDTFIQPGETYLLLTKSNRVFKRLFYTDDKAGFLCYSDNTMKYDTGPLAGKYANPPFEVPLSEVISVFDVTGMIKRNRNSGIINRQK